MNRAVKYILVFDLTLNVMACLGFMLLAGARPMFTEGRVRSCYTALDRAGVINEKALREFDPSLASNPRFMIPRYIAKSALEAATEHATAGFIVAILNVLFVIGAIQLSRTAQSGEQTLAQNKSEGNS